MITINLLPHEKRRKKAHIKVPQATIVAAAALAACGMGGYWYAVKWETQQLRADIAATQSEIARNREIVQLVEQYTRDKQRLQDRLSLIEQLADTQRSPVRLLDDISQALPDGGWLTGISKVSGKLTIQGYASSHFVVAELMLGLQRLTATIKNVELNFSELDIHEGKPVERFEIIAILSG